MNSSYIENELFVRISEGDEAAISPTATGAKRFFNVIHFPISCATMNYRGCVNNKKPLTKGAIKKFF